MTSRYFPLRGGCQLTARTAGIASTAALLRADHTAPNARPRRGPAAAAAGPAAANATGPNANAMTVWNAVTRASAAGAIRCCSTADVCPVTGRARLSYRRAAEIFSAATRPLDPAGHGWTPHQLGLTRRVVSS